MPEGWLSLWELGQTQCSDACCNPPGGVDLPAGRLSSDGQGLDEAADAAPPTTTTPPTRLVIVAQATAGVLRLVAWLVHGLLDGAIFHTGNSLRKKMEIGKAA